jgi:glycosyltransferase involved in cell wall biosynthesis
MTPLRLLHVIPTLAPSAGGPTRVIQDLAKAQAAAGHFVAICTTDRDCPAHLCLPSSYFTRAFPSPIQVYSFRVQYDPLLVSIGMACWLRKEISAFDIVEIHGIYRFPSSFAAHQARKCKVPYVIRPHGSLDPYLYERSSVGKLAFKRIYERCFDLPNLHKASAIHFTAIEERERAAFLNLRAPSFVIPNGLDWSRFQKLPAKGWLRASLGLSDQPLVLFLGRLHFKKGLDLLIPAFDALRCSISDVQLVIAGPENDDYGKKVRGWVQERGLGSHVHFIGSLKAEDTLKAYVDADVFALPSYTENFGLTVIESLACFLPVVITDQVNIHADVSGAGAGIVTRCEVDEIAHALQTLLTDPGRRHAMGHAGRRLVEIQYTWPHIIEELTRVYEALISYKTSPNHQDLPPCFVMEREL